MSFGMFFYLADVIFAFKIILGICLIIIVIVILILGVCFLEDGHNEDDIESIRFRKAIRCTWLPVITIILFLVLLPNKQTMYIIGGEKAVYAIVENKDNKEVIDLVKQITIKKLKELAKDGE